MALYDLVLFREQGHAICFFWDKVPDTRGGLCHSVGLAHDSLDLAWVGFRRWPCLPEFLPNSHLHQTTSTGRSSGHALGVACALLEAI